MYRAAEPQDSAPPSPAPAAPTIFEAIVKHLCVTATWNRDKVVLAPHIIYTRHGEVFVDAITVARNNMLPREVKLGTYKLAGLADLKLTQRGFEPNAVFEAEAERYAGVTLMAIETAAA